ncbi:hypothetical protein AAJ76_1790001624 [Vairimorpha ceranae]|uniref:Uncharacterized protein n=1 Tax=Vairimorpha ceranae TaxID=40302 RepID=A0A0F9W857_9MICR|nr:hypothetical protein AAJ76_1790001624 [Vairimorpha ceranae]KKO73911.1 hypothetical protein AAJ76_1790001624 [Vairimorpha ceranae]
MLYNRRQIPCLKACAPASHRTEILPSKQTRLKMLSCKNYPLYLIIYK